ncbi:MAG: polysaccharide biosynthesis C-terminal domain-containing protein [Dehalococcoidia bacterium]|nr:polysaccharide biosynthesis C-terminal domain-containing protein [Dehalococcoidia bacterium]
MRKDFTRLAKIALIYGSGTVVAQAAAVLLLPLYSRALTPADYGILAVVGLATGIITPFLSMGLGNGLVRYYYEYESAQERQQLVRTCLVAVVMTSLAVTALAWVALEPVVRVVFSSADYTSYLRIGLATAFFTSLAAIPRYTLRVQQRATWFVAFTVGQLLFSIGLGIYLVVIRHYGVMGALTAGLIGSVAAALAINILTLLENGLGRVSVPMVLRCFRFGIYQVPDSIGAATIGLADRWFIERYSTLANLGLYNVGYRFGQGVQILAVGPLEQAAGPYAYSTLKRPDFRPLWARITTYSLLVAAFVALLISLHSDNIVRLLTVPAYYGAAAVAPLIALASVLELTNWCVSGGFGFAEKPKFAFAMTVLGGIVNLLANWVLVPRYGMMGAASSTILAFAFMSVASYVLAQRLYPIRYEYGRVARIIVAALGLFAVGRLTAVDNLAANFLLQSLLALALFPALLATGFFTKSEINTVTRAWTALKERRLPEIGRA